MRKQTSLLILASLMIAGLAFLATPGPEIDALPANSVLTLYYSDASFEEQVGYRYISCVSGGSSSGGEVTEFYEREIMPC